MKYVPGLMVGQLSGKAGSTVASRNKGGSYFRTRVIPKHVVNVFTSLARESFGNAAQQFRLLTEEQREAWNSLGASITVKTSLGESIHLTGLQALVQINRNLQAASLPSNFIAPALDTPPAYNGAGLTAVAGVPGNTTVVLGANSATQHLTSTTGMFVGQSLYFATAAVWRTVATVTDGTHVVLTEAVPSTTAEVVDFTDIPTVSFSFDPSPIPTGVSLLVYATAGLSQGVSRPSKGEFRLLTAIGAGQTTPTDLASTYFARFGSPAAGTKIFHRSRFVTASGFAGPEYADFTIVT